MPATTTAFAIAYKGEEHRYALPPSAPLSEVLYRFCKDASVRFEAMRFYFDGAQVRRDDTLAELELEDGQAIKAIHIQYCTGKACKLNYQYLPN